MAFHTNQIIAALTPQTLKPDVFPLIEGVEYTAHGGVNHVWTSKAMYALCKQRWDMSEGEALTIIQKALPGAGFTEGFHVVVVEMTKRRRDGEHD